MRYRWISTRSCPQSGGVSRSVRTKCVHELGPRPTIEIAFNGRQPHLQERILRRMKMQGRLQMRLLAHRQVDQEIVALAEGVTSSDVTRAAAIDKPAEVVARWVAVPAASEIIKSLTSDDNIVRRPLDTGGYEVLALIGPTDLNQGHLSEVAAAHDEYGMPALTIKFTPLGANHMTALTMTNRSTSTRARYRGVIIDGDLQQAPRVVGTVTNETRLGGFATLEEVDDLAAVLQQGPFRRNFVLSAVRR
jgi:hypothetical protein